MDDVQSNVVALVQPPTFDAKLRTQVVEMLETALERAKRGEVVCLVLCVENSDGFYESAWTGASDVAQRLGMLRMAEHRILLTHQHLPDERETD